MKNRRRFKPIIAFVASVCILTTSIPAFSADTASQTGKLYDMNVEFSSASGEIKISGTTTKKKTEFLNIVIADYGADVMNLLKNDADDSVALKTVKTDGLGTADVTIGLPDNILANKRCEYHVFGDDDERTGIIFTLSDGELDDVVSAVNGGEADCALKISSCPLNDGRVGLSSENIAKIAAYVIKGKPLSGYTEESFITAYMNAEGFIRAKSGIISVEECADEYSTYIEQDLLKNYDKLNSDVKAAFETALKNYVFEGVTDQNKIYNELIFVAECITAKSSADLKSMVVKYFSENGLDLTSYNNLPNDARREAAFDEVYIERANIKTLGDVKSILAEKVAAEAEKATDIDNKFNGGGSSGGGRGSGGGGGTTFATSPASSNDSSENAKNGVFDDMADHWAKDYAAKLFKKGIINGFPDGSFQPENNITRAEFAKMAVSALGLKSNGADLYSDVAADSWYYSFVAAASEAKLINGDGNKFLPESMITRQDAAAILARAIIYKNAALPESEANLSDLASVADYASDAVKNLYGIGIITGDNGKFRPFDNLTRAEASAMFVRFCDYLDGDGKTVSKNTKGFISDDFKITELPIKFASLSSDFLSGIKLAAVDIASEQIAEDNLKEEDVKYEENAKYKEAKTIVSAIADGETFFDENSDGVTRGEFLHALLKLTKKYYSGSNVQIFSDVPADHKYADDVKCAVDLNIISKGETFRPNDVITANEAAKIMVTAMGYSLVAESRGGYPIGYRAVAMNLGFMKGVGLKGENISGENAVMMLFNLLSSEVDNIKYEDGGSAISYSGGESSLLHKVYKIHNFEGFVTAVGNHSLTMDATYTEKENYVEIDGVSFELDEVSPDMLGKKVTAYLRDDGEKELVCISEKDNSEISVRAKDFENLSGASFKYYDGDRIKTLSMDSAYKVIYNGRRISAWNKSMADEDFTRLRLLDNDDDGSYEVLFVDAYSYGTLNGVDYKNMSVGIKFEKRQLDLSDNTSVIEIYNSEGEQTDLFRLENGMTVAIRESADKKFYQIRVCGKTVSGKVRQIAEKNKEIYIDDAKYSFSTYFYNKYINKNLVLPGQSITVVLGMDGEVTELSSLGGSMKYAYLISAMKSKGLKDKAKLKLYSADGEMKVFEISDKTKIDGAGSYNGDEVVTRLSLNVFPYVIRYGLDGEEKINSIDLAAAAGDDLAEILDPSNSLRKNYTKQTLVYRSGSRGFNSYALLRGSIVMFVPESGEYLTDEDRYQIGTYDLLTSGARYSVELYDIDENGNAGLAVIYEDSNTDLAKHTRLSYIIEEINECMKDGEVMRELVCYGNKTYTSLYLPDDVKIKKTSGNDLVPGDIIRLKTKGDIIQNVYVDFDLSSGKYVFDSLGGSSYGSRICNNSLEFMSGKVYSVNSSSLVISNTENTDGTYNFLASNLFPYSMNSAEIVCFDKEKSIASPVEVGMIHSYLGYGNDADFVVIRQGDGSMKNVYIIR